MKNDYISIAVLKPEKELEYTEDNKFISETSDDNSLPYNDDNLNKIMHQYYGIDNSESPVEIEANDNLKCDISLNGVAGQKVTKIEDGKIYDYSEISDTLMFPFHKRPDLPVIFTNNKGKSRHHTTKHQPTDKVKKKARRNNRRAKRNNS